MLNLDIGRFSFPRVTETIWAGSSLLPVFNKGRGGNDRVEALSGAVTERPRELGLGKGLFVMLLAGEGWGEGNSEKEGVDLTDDPQPSGGRGLGESPILGGRT